MKNEFTVKGIKWQRDEGTDMWRSDRIGGNEIQLQGYHGGGLTEHEYFFAALNVQAWLAMSNLTTEEAASQVLDILSLKASNLCQAFGDALKMEGK